MLDKRFELCYCITVLIQLMFGGDAMPWSFEESRPIYTQLVERIQRRIVTGAYPQGGRLPSVRDLAQEAGVNPNTVQRAFA